MAKGPSKEEPMSLGRFTVTGVLGRGGMGAVYEATDVDGEAVALKVLYRGESADPRLLRRFEREAAIRIEHPVLVRVIDSGSDDGARWIAFERVAGETLSARLRTGGMAPRRAVDLAIALSEGLSAAHAHGVVHRDLKPGNVILTPEGGVKLIDFGIAYQEGAARLTEMGSSLGTPGYQSPEQAQGEPTVDVATDVWGVGGLLYAMLSGRCAFDRGTMVATMLAAVVEDPEPLPEVVSGLPDELWPIIERCLEKRPADRWQSMDALADALRRVEIDESASVRPSRPPRALPEHERRLVAVLYAEVVTDFGALRAAINEGGGVAIALRDERAVGVFGGRAWAGDEVLRAAEAALAARHAVGRVGVGNGRAEQHGASFSGEAVRAAEVACAMSAVGVAVERRALGGAEGRLVGEPLLERHLDVRAVSETAADADTPLIGRDAELSRIAAAIERFEALGSALEIRIDGPAGIGKSRLRAAAESRLARGPRPVRLLKVRAEARTSGFAFGLLRRLVAALAGTSVHGEDWEARLAHALSNVVADPGILSDALAPLFARVGLEEPDTRPDPEVEADRLRMAADDLLGALLERGPLALSLEDLQWADDASLDLLDELVGRHASEPLLVIATARPELAERRADARTPGGGRVDDRSAPAEVIRLTPRPLRREQIEELVCALSPRPLEAEVVARIAERTGGNPFFVEQVVREIGEGDASGEIPIPLTVEGAVQSRLDHLPRSEKSLLMRAAVLGEVFSEAGLGALGVAEPARLLRSLAQRRLVLPALGDEHAFASALVAAVAYRMNPEEQLAELHRRAGAWLHGTGVAEPEEVAIHLERGHEMTAAGARYAEATFAAARRGDTRSVMRCSERALAFGALEARCGLHVIRADALAFLGLREEQRAELDAALACAGGDRERARVCAQLAELLVGIGRNDAACTVAEEAVAHAQAAGDPDALAEALVRHGAAHLYLGRLERAAELIGAASALEDEASPSTAALVAAWRGQLASARGDLVARRDGYRDAAARYRQIGAVRRAVGEECNLADTYNRVGAWSEAEAALREAISGCARVDFEIMRGYALANLGYALGMQRRSEEAARALDEAVAVGRACSDPRLEAAAAVYRARVDLHVRPAEDVAAEAQAAAERVEELGMKGLCASALAVAAQAWLSAGEVSEALAASGRALALRDELGSVEEDEAEIFLVRAQALDSAGDRDGAEQTWERGAARVRELAAAITDDDWRARFLGHIPAHQALVG